MQQLANAAASADGAPPGNDVVCAGRHMRIDFLLVFQRMFAATAATQGFCLSCDWAQLYKSAILSHIWDQWYAVDYVMRTVPVPYIGMVVKAYHLYVDGSYYRKCFLT